MTLHELREKINPVRSRESLRALAASNGVNSRDIFFSAVVVLVGFASFGLGRLSLLESKREPVQIENALAASIGGVKGQEEKITLGGQIVASKSGSKYHYPWCAGATQISEKNKMWFASVEEARKAGYAPASNCKGLK